MSASFRRSSFGLVGRLRYEDDDPQSSSEAVDLAVDTSAWADCETSSSASETDESSGTSFTADSKSSHALSRSPVGAFSTSWASLSTWFQSSSIAETSAWYSSLDAVPGSCARSAWEDDVMEYR